MPSNRCGKPAEPTDVSGTIWVIDRVLGKLEGIQIKG